MQPYRPPHLRQQAAPPSIASSSSASPAQTNGSPPACPLSSNPTSSAARQQHPPSRNGHPGYTGQSSRGAWNRGYGGGDLASPAGDIRPMRSSHHAYTPRTSPHLPSGSNTRGSPAPRTGELDMEMIQSVSRSGGDGAEGDALKDWGIQEQYRGYIDQRMDKHYATFSTPRDIAPPSKATEELESLTSIVLLFRKLREGVVASHRIDAFAVEVFESSAKMAILANHRAQALASLSGLVPGLYGVHWRASNGETEGTGGRAETQRLDEALESLSLSDKATPNGHASTSDQRIHFASLLLLYHLVLSSSAVFQGQYEDLTLPSRPALAPNPNSEPSSSPSTPNTPPFVSSSDLVTVKRARKALSADLFDPLKYWALLADDRTTSYERAILAWAGNGVRERAWEMIKKVYIELGLERAGQMLNLPEEELLAFAAEKGAKVDNGRIKLR